MGNVVWKACCSANEVYALLQDIGSVILVAFMFMGVLPMDAKLCHNFNLLPNCANHVVIGATRLPLGPICANQSLSLAELCQSNFVI